MTDSRALFERRDTVLFSNPNGDAGDVRAISGVTWVGVATNVALAALKLIAGLLGGSRALLADAAHTISDLATDVAILIGVRFWSAPADADHPHGHAKIETLITLSIGLALAAVGLGMGYDAVANLAAEGGSGPGASTSGLVMWLGLGSALLSLVTKELLYRWTVAKGMELSSSALIANAWHHRTDAFSSIPPLISIGGNAIAARHGLDLWYLDPIATIVICVLLLQAAWEVAQPTLAALLDRSADRKLCSAIRRAVLDTRGVIGAHRIRTRCLSANAVAVDLNITVDGRLSVTDGHAIAARVRAAILALSVENSPKPVDVLVHVDPAGSDHEESRRRLAADTMLDWKERGKTGKK